MLFGTNNLERMRIEAGGNVGIGITAATSAKLHILDNAVTSWQQNFGDNRVSWRWKFDVSPVNFDGRHGKHSDNSQN